MVKISTKYPLTEEQTSLLDEKKQHWWLKDLETSGFVKAFPRLGSSEAVDVDIELVDSKYCLGCGDWNVTDSQGYHCSKRVYFKVSNGSVKYFKSKAELDADVSVADGQTSIPDASGTSGYSAFGSVSAQEKPTDTGVEEVLVDTEIAMFCIQDKKTVSRNYNCVMNFSKRCEELNEDDCFNCKHGRQLFYKNVKE